jgi:lipopolysaccharide biosynthesis glycosyltransferase
MNVGEINRLINEVCYKNIYGLIETVKYKASCMKKNVPVVFSTDKNFFPYFLVALESIIQNSNLNVGYKIILLHADLTESDEKIILERIKNHPNFSICLIDVSDLAEKYELNKFMTDNRLRVSTYYRLLIGEILKEYDKIIYLDCDLILNKDIALLYETDIKDNYLAAVLDRGAQDYFLKSVPAFKKYMQHLGMKTVENYFNAGVLIMNLKAIRENKLLEKFLQVAQENNQFFHDQNVLNVACEGKVFYLDSSWNIQCCNRINEKELGIIHYAGNKPWNKKGVNLEKYWWNYAKNTFFYQTILDDYKKNVRQHKKIKFKKLKYKILYKLSFGKVRQKYKQKYNEVK